MPQDAQPAATRQVSHGTRPAGLPWPTVVRGILVSVGPSVLLDGLVTASLVATARGWLTRPRSRVGRAARPLLAIGAAFPAIYFLALRPWHRRWGATEEDTHLPLPGDDLVPDPGYEHTRAVTVEAPAEAVWPWLAQIGQDRGGFYSYDWLENLAGCDIHSADRIHPEWQAPRPGDTLAVLRGWGPPLVSVEPGKALTIRGWGTYAVLPLGAQRSRLLARTRQPWGWGVLAYLLLLEIPHFVMERRMLLGLKARAERAVRGPTLLDEVLPTYGYGGTVTAAIQAPPAAIFRALREVTLGEMPLAYALGTIRYLPGLLTGRMQRRPDELSRPFSEVAGWLVLAEQPDRELVVGSIGKLHDLLDQQFVALNSPAAFRRFDEPDYEKFVQGFRIAGGDAASGYTLVAEHRTQVLGTSARWKFALYWYLLVGWSGNQLLRMLLQAVKRRAEREGGVD